MAFLKICLLVLSAFFVFGTAASFSKSAYWWVRIFDFPRLQIAVLLLLLLTLFAVSFGLTEPWHWGFASVLTASFVAQCVMIFPYTRLAKKQVARWAGREKTNVCSFIASNVLTPNRHSEKLLELVKKMKPDLLLTLETDKWWENQLAGLEEDYGHTVKIPRDNLYGMHLYSKLRLHDVRINYLFDKGVPSIEAYVELRSGERIKIYCLHPKPPVPAQGDDTSEKRDAELLLVGRQVEKLNVPALVFGDLNDVAWSHTTKLFQKISKLLDPRIGRGFFSTFHANYPFLRWPLDHIFHSSHFTLNDIRVLPGIGSDHFPIYFSLGYNPQAQDFQEEPEADEKEEKESKEKIQSAQMKAE